MNPIRPAGYPAPPPANPAADQARLAAQRAFFDQALGRAGGPAPTRAASAPQAPVATAAPAVAPAPQPVRAAPQAPVATAAPAVAPAPQPVRAAPQAPAADAPAKPPRPGSILDIRV